jgi:sodium-dependent dicarboxylate transporter 2/3/5
MVIFIGGVLVIGGAVGAPETGIPMALEQAFAPLLGGLPEHAFVFVLALGVTLVTGIISNLVSISIFVPLGVTLSQALGVGSPVAVGLTLGMGAGLAYLLPSATTSNAIVAGSGWLRVGQMLRYGALLGVVHALVLAGFTYPLAKWLFS